MKVGMTFVGCLLTMFLGACQPIEPDYPVAAIAYDPGLIGVWRSDEEEARKAGDVRIEPMTTPVAQGRLSHRVGNTQTGVKGEPNGYRIFLPPPKEGERPLELHAYTVRAGERTLLGFQVSDERLDGAAFLMLAIPIHWVVLVERDGDRLEAGLPREMVGWVPLIGWLDAKGEETPLPEELPGSDGRLLVTNSADRPLEVYAKYGARDEFWEGERIVYTRVVETPAQKEGGAP